MGGFKFGKKGSHRAYKHQSKIGIVTVAYHRIKDEAVRHKNTKSWSSCFPGLRRAVGRCLPASVTQQDINDAFVTF